MAMAEYDWGEILMEIAANIHKHVELYDDYEAFAEICSSWRSATKEFPCRYINRKHTQLPWLMLVDPDDSSYRRFYSLTKHKFLKIDLPPSLISPPQVRRYFSSRGWLISLTNNVTETTSEHTYFNMILFDPFSNNNITIEPPLFHQSGLVPWQHDMLLSFFGKFAVSTSPSPLSKANAKGNDDDFVVAMTYGEQRKLAYWRLGQDDSWVVPYSLGLNTGWFFDLCFFRGELYAIDSDGKVIAFGDFKEDHKNRRQPRVVGDVVSIMGNRHGLGDWDDDPEPLGFETYTYYLTESKCDQGDTSSLLVVHRLVSVVSEKENKYETTSFKVFKLDVDNGKVEQVKSLGNQAIFVGFNSTFTVQACANVDEDKGCKADCIYYTDDSYEVYLFTMGGSDMGIYSLAQGNTHPFYGGPSRFSIINTPIWVEFCSA